MCPNKECRQPFRAPASIPEESVKPAKSSGRMPARKRPGKKQPATSRPTPKRKQTRGKRKRRQKRSVYPVVAATCFGVVFLLGFFTFWFRSDNGDADRGTIVAADQLNPLAKVDFEKEITPFFQKYCLDCHSADFQEGDFSFDRYADGDSIKRDREIWTKVQQLVRLGAMPPADSDQPSKDESQKIIDWIDYQLFFVDCSVPHDPGRVTARRLNRTEFNNTVRDLLNVDFSPADDFPSDDVGYGFDNIGDVLSVPPLLIEKYLTAAEQIAEKAIITQHPKYISKRAFGKELKEEGAVSSRGDGSKAIVSRGRVYHQFNLPESGTYRLIIEASADQAGDELAKMELKLNERVLKVQEIQGHREENLVQLEFEGSAGKQTLSAAFINDFFNPKAEKQKDRNLMVRSLRVEGPLGIPDSVRESNSLLKVYPENGVSVSHAAQSNFREFLPRAFRRPVTEAEITQYVSFVEMASERGASFAESMRIGLQAILVSPHFLFRVEESRQQVGEMEQLDDFALATRMSYFIWSSLPDEELFQLAKENRLHEPQVLKEQTERMLADPKSEALVKNFSGQWLGLRKLTTNEVSPDTALFPDFNEKLRLDMWKETELYFGSIVHENRSLYDLLDGRYSFLNERLAKLYGIENIKGEDFRRVEFKNSQRLGVLTHASILTLTSYPDRTSPVKRGQWVLENFLNDAPPNPPPTVPGIEETQSANPNLSFREQLEIHRKDPGCAACHVTMDEIGFGLENFDAIGRWRTQDGKFEVNASGTLPTGESFNGPEEMIAVLRSRKTQFGRCVAEKMLTYALGRGLEYYDRCAIDKIMIDLDSDDRFSVLVTGIIQSAPFQLRRNNK